MPIVREIGFTALSAAVSIVVLFLLAKLIGARQVSQMTMFDYVVGISIGSVAAELAVETQRPLVPLTALVVYGAAAVGIAVLTNKSLKARTAVTGKPLILLENGVIYRENLRKAHLDLDEFLTYCRIGGWFDLNELETAVLEHNGAVSFLPRETARPATPMDLDLSPQQTRMQVPFIMDGRLMAENIERAGKEPSWVRSCLQRQGYQAEQEVLLAVWDGDADLTVFPMDPHRKSTGKP